MAPPPACGWRPAPPWRRRTSVAPPARPPPPSLTKHQNQQPAAAAAPSGAGPGGGVASGQTPEGPLSYPAHTCLVAHEQRGPTRVAEVVEKQPRALRLGHSVPAICCLSPLAIWLRLTDSTAHPTVAASPSLTWLETKPAVGWCTGSWYGSGLQSSLTESDLAGDQASCRLVYRELVWLWSSEQPHRV
ncbi:unnamed protein product [Gadus morhua 'NCC']